MTDDYLKSVCKIGHGKETCRYIMMGNEGFICAKTNKDLFILIESRKESMNAKGDNCEGDPDAVLDMEVIGENS